jgi:hypothetical protein
MGLGILDSDDGYNNLTLAFSRRHYRHLFVFRDCWVLHRSCLNDCVHSSGGAWYGGNPTNDSQGKVPETTALRLRVGIPEKESLSVSPNSTGLAPPASKRHFSPCVPRIL